MPPLQRPRCHHNVLSSRLSTTFSKHSRLQTTNSLLPLSPLTSTSISNSFSDTHPQTQQRRNAATTRRMTKALRVAPSATATPGSKYLVSGRSSTRETRTPSRSSPSLSPTTTSTATTLVFNPPPSTPNPYQTPPLFLPANDPRKTLLAQAHAFNNPYASGERELPPSVRAAPAHEKKYHMTEANIERMRQLRAEDPWEWTVPKLAEEFGCSKIFVGIAAPASEERREWGRALHQRFRDRWGNKRTEAVEARHKRRKLWEMDL